MTGATQRLVLPIATSAQSRREFMRAMGGRRWQLVGIVVVLTAGAAAGLVTPTLLGSMVDSVSAGTASSGDAWRTGGWIALSAVAAALLSGLGLVLAARLFETVLARIRERLVSKALDIPQSVVEKAGTGDLVSRASDDVSQISAAVPEVVPAVSGALFTIVVTFAGLAILDLRYALALALVVPIHVLTLRWYLRTAPQIYAAERAAMAERAHHVLASLRGIDTVRAYRLEGAHSLRMARASWDVVRWSMRARIVQNSFFGRLNLAEFIGMSAILVAGFWMIDAGVSTIGAATTAMLFFLRLFDPINQLLFVIDSLQSAAASLNRIVGVIVAEDEAPPVTDDEAAAGPPADIVMRARDLTFGYASGQLVLDGLQLSIAAGERVAVVGTSGAGKTTLAALVAGVHQPVAGSVVHADSSSVLLVTQEVHLFTGTLRDNLTLVRPSASDEELMAALDTVEGRDIVTTLAEGLDTLLGAGGHELTPAQAQHVALARVVIADPALAVLDEATAEAGSASAGLLDRATAAALRGRAGLVVAHRLSQTAIADRVVVMEEGRFVEEGTHAELLAAGGRYADLWSAWSRGRPDAGRSLSDEAASP